MSTAKAPSYILRYFNLAGRGETARLLLAAANVEWTEENPKWPQEKANQPFGRLPVLIEKSTDGSPDFVICESTNIERYIARIYGILPADPKQSAIQEQLREQLVDVSFEEILSKIIAVQTKIIKDNGNTGRMFGDSLSYADIASYAFYRCMVFGYKMFKNDIVDIVKPKLTPEIIKLISTVETDPALATHLSKAKVLSAELSA